MSDPHPDSAKSKNAVRYTLDGDGAEINHLIYHEESAERGEAIVYVDHDLDLEWESDPKADQYQIAAGFREGIREVANAVAVMEALVHNWPDALKLLTKRLLGEALACALCGESKQAERALEAARNFVESKSPQVARFWMLSCSLIWAAIAGCVAVGQMLFHDCVVAAIGNAMFWALMCFWAGCIGAVLFLIAGLGKRTAIDSLAEKRLHQMEVAARIATGGIGGLLAGAFVQMGIILPIFSHTGAQHLSMAVAAFAAGASERIAAGLITKTEQAAVRSLTGGHKDE